MISAHLSAAKPAVFGASFALLAALQVLAPYQRHFQAVLKNWRTNFALGLFCVIALGWLTGGSMLRFCDFVIQKEWGALGGLNIPPWLKICIGFIALDLATYLWHRANHRSGLLWRFHSVHHSDIVLDASSAVRFHPGEIIGSMGMRAIIVLALGIDAVTYLVFELIYTFSNLFVHAHVKLPRKLESALSTVFVTPGIHRKHHSVQWKEANSNYGTILSGWDRLFGTWTQGNSKELVTLGLPSGNRAHLSLIALLKLPFKKKISGPAGS